MHNLKPGSQVLVRAKVVADDRDGLTIHLGGIGSNIVPRSKIADVSELVEALRDTASSLATLGPDGWSEAPHLLRVIRAALAKFEAANA